MPLSPPQLPFALLQLSMNSPDNEGMDMSLVRRYCPKFRVLIIGKANAGKTTILQKVCNTTENPTAVDTDESFAAQTKRWGMIMDPPLERSSDNKPSEDNTT